MFGLFLNQLLLLAAAGVIGFAMGWRLRAASHDVLVRGIRRDLNDLTRRVGEAQVRRARRL
ncbi:MAG: hypothetical protein NW203_11050 [Hyphomonadaceae bacterium]|nr:hypothetical protein [Hyphomonadaceae bacterium]